MKRKLWLLLFTLLLIGGCGLWESTDTGGTENRTEVDVLSVIDGDTVKIMYDGKEETVRYLLVDTPETNHPRFGEQPLGKEATEENRQIIESGDVTIEFDAGERYDDYGRLLAYFYVDGESVQEQLLQSGMARVAYVYPPNTRYLDDFKQAEQIAKDAGTGIWAVKDYATDRGFDPSAFTDSVNIDAQEECRIKGNINSSGARIYHLPGTHSYEQTNPEKWFCSEQEAQEAGFRNAAN
ncbi:thermonuclease family protein [Planococcus salinus]|uniref:Thermonuclease family protein n=1 Tax=Planococcus salinus TaxID=1848460 RepID=A0A3M8P496_9BACL|nr:thermonuclease family protein [Planococcus salinus]RNF38498.1 thermonuclease family protein [Planococcus salinus]